MKRFMTLIGLLFAAGLLAGYLLLGRPSLKSQAQAAYEARDYARSYALYKQYAESPAVRNNNTERNQAIMRMVELQKLLAPPAAVAAAPASAPDMLSQAISYAMQNPDNPPMDAASRIPHAKPKYGEVVAMSIIQMGNFEFDPGTDADVPADVHLLEGAHVRLNGFMIPLTQAIKVDKFALVPTLSGCACTFAGPPGVQHIVTCTTPRDKTLDYVLDELEIEGILHVHVIREDGYTSSIFELDVTGARIRELGP